MIKIIWKMGLAGGITTDREGESHELKKIFIMIPLVFTLSRGRMRVESHISLISNNSQS